MRKQSLNRISQECKGIQETALEPREVTATTRHLLPLFTQRSALQTLNCHKKGQQQLNVLSCVAPCLLALELWPDRDSSQSQSSRKYRPEQALGNPWATKLNPLNSFASSHSRVGPVEQNPWAKPCMHFSCLPESPTHALWPLRPNLAKWNLAFCYGTQKIWILSLRISNLSIR